MMLCGRSSELSNRVNQEETNFLDNGSILLEKLLSFSNGNYSPIRRFSTEEILQATNNFDTCVEIRKDSYHILYKGSLGSHLVSIKRYRNSFSTPIETMKALATRDMVINSQMNKHKNVLKFLGCCLEFQLPVLVYEYAGTPLLSNCLESRASGVDHDLECQILSWKSRLTVATRIANAIVYLHTALPRFVVHRDLKPSGIIVDQLNVAKLFDFSLSISIPAGETEVEDVPTGTFGYIDPEYCVSGYVSGKSDAYSFGICLLSLLTGQNPCHRRDKDNLVEYVMKNVNSNQLNEIVDPRILEEIAGTVKEHQLQPFVALALRCTQLKGEDRPDMIDVAKELRKIERSVQFVKLHYKTSILMYSIYLCIYPT